jgi:hypothetical protein
MRTTKDTKNTKEDHMGTQCWLRQPSLHPFIFLVRLVLLVVLLFLACFRRTPAENV